MSVEMIKKVDYVFRKYLYEVCIPNLAAAYTEVYSAVNKSCSDVQPSVVRVEQANGIGTGAVTLQHYPNEFPEQLKHLPVPLANFVNHGWGNTYDVGVGRGLVSLFSHRPNKEVNRTYILSPVKTHILTASSTILEKAIKDNVVSGGTLGIGHYQSGSTSTIKRIFSARQYSFDILELTLPILPYFNLPARSVAGSDYFGWSSSATVYGNTLGVTDDLTAILRTPIVQEYCTETNGTPVDRKPTKWEKEIALNTLKTALPDERVESFVKALTTIQTYSTIVIDLLRSVTGVPPGKASVILRSTPFMQEYYDKYGSDPEALILAPARSIALINPVTVYGDKLINKQVFDENYLSGILPIYKLTKTIEAL